MQGAFPFQMSAGQYDMVLIMSEQTVKTPLRMVGEYPIAQPYVGADVAPGTYLAETSLEGSKPFKSLAVVPSATSRNYFEYVSAFGSYSRTYSMYPDRVAVSAGDISLGGCLYHVYGLHGGNGGDKVLITGIPVRRNSFFAPVWAGILQFRMNRTHNNLPATDGEG